MALSSLLIFVLSFFYFGMKQTMVNSMASSIKVLVRANKGQCGLVNRSNLVVLLEPKLVVQVITVYLVLERKNKVK